MKKIIVLFLMSFIFITVFSQERKIKLELGANYPLGLNSKTNAENHIGFYVSGIYDFHNNPFSLNIKLSYDSYTINKDDYNYNGRSTYLLPYIDYNIKISNKTSFYVGMGAGISADNINKGVFNNGYKIRFLASPQIGMLFYNHIKVSSQYIISNKNTSRLMLGVGYMF